MTNIAITDEYEGSYYFDMPADNVTISAVFSNDLIIEPSALELAERSSKELTAAIRPDPAAFKDISWASSDDSVGKATKYIIYGNKCGKTSKPRRLYVSTGNTKTFTKIAGSKVKKGTYYKFIIVALDKDDKVVSTSKLIHVATKGGKVGNHKSVKVRKSVLNKAKALKKGKTLKLGAKAVAQSSKLKVKKHVGLRYETTNKKAAIVFTNGTIKAKGKGTCYVYAYAQNGVYMKIKVVIK